MTHGKRLGEAEACEYPAARLTTFKRLEAIVQRALAGASSLAAFKQVAPFVNGFESEASRQNLGPLLTVIGTAIVDFLSPSVRLTLLVLIRGSLLTVSRIPRLISAITDTIVRVSAGIARVAATILASRSHMGRRPRPRTLH